MLGVVRACAAIISYEIVVGTILIIVILITQTASFSVVIDYQNEHG
jgi:NADH:ubiquinone oxidoreductase subunit H